MSSTPKEKNVLRTLSFWYLGATLFSVLVTVLYYVFDHGLRDPHMTFLFLIPLVPGLIVFGLSWTKFVPCSASRYAFNIATSLVWVYFLLMGIYTMAKTSSEWLFLFYVFGAIGYLTAIIIEIIYRAKTCKKEK